MTVRMYSSLDPGAPTLLSSSGARMLDNLRIILDACLVTGYGLSPAAGWTKAHDIANGFSYSNGTGVINFYLPSNNQATHVEVAIMEAVLDGSTALAGGVNRRSGQWFDGEATANRQFFWGGPAGQQAYKAWALVADSKTAILLVENNTTGLLDPSYSQSQGLYFGDYYPVLGGVGFGCFGGGSTLGSGRPYLFRGAPESGMVLRNPMTGLVDQGTAPKYGIDIGVGEGAFHRSSDFIARALRLQRAGVYASGAGLSGSASGVLLHAGVLRGVMSDPVLARLPYGAAMQALGLPLALPSDRLKSHLINGKELWPLRPNSVDMLGLVSLDPADWEPLWS